MSFTPLSCLLELYHCKYPMLVANVDGEVKFLGSEDTLLRLLTPSSYLVVVVAGAVYEE